MTAPTITEFLTARLNEDEAIARKCPRGPWKPDADHLEVLSSSGEPVCEGFALSGAQLRAAVVHVSRHDPARILRRVEAERALLELHRPEDLGQRAVCEECSAGYEVLEWAPEYPCTTVRTHALAYADHPDYQEEWRP